MSNHTPGDWRIEPCDGGYQIWDESGVACIATVHADLLPDATGLANAKLIAAAPKLLTATETLLDYLEPMMVRDPYINAQAKRKAKAAKEAIALTT
jgi:hypothetical protein